MAFIAATASVYYLVDYIADSISFYILTLI